ncbi:MAG: hypothetical protein IKN12_11275 [Selenomonadaceae bacterium]|nr:hypothetical protein [Selenomonadaceae bacterium]MBR3723323.1 hypothetical protein [Selenomonadaceae bacterium]
MKYVTVDGDTMILSVPGNYKFSITKAIDYEVQTAYQNGCTKAVIDFNDTTTMDSASLRQLTKIYRQVNKENFSAKNAKGLVLAVLKQNNLENWLR